MRMLESPPPHTMPPETQNPITTPGNADRAMDALELAAVAA